LNSTLDISNPESSGLREQVGKLEKINRALMGRVERSMDFAGTGFSLFQTAVLLEDKIKVRTRDLEHTLSDLSDSYVRLQEARDDAEVAKQNLTAAIEAVSEGFALFDESETLVMCNAPFRALMPDVGYHFIPGITFAKMTELFITSRFLVLDARKNKADWRSTRLDVFRKPNASFIQQFAGDRWIQVSNKKTVAGATVIFQTDITDTVRNERIRHEKELDEQSRILQATIDHLPQGICMFSKDLRLRAWNSRFIELLSLQVKQVVLNASFSRMLETLTGDTFSIDPNYSTLIKNWITDPSAESLNAVQILRSDGLVLSVSTNVMPDGGVVASFTDVTQERLATFALREAKEHLEQRVEERTGELKREVIERRSIETELIKAKNAAEDADKGKTRFLAAASHDLLQPLNAARLFLSLLSEADLDSRQSRFAEKVDNAFGSVEQLLESLLDISRFDSNSVETNPAPLSLRELFDTLITEYLPVAERKGLQLICVRPNHFVMSDQNLLRRIVQNLLSNAIRYTDQGRVLLGARRQGNLIKIEVWDTGIGIPADKTEVIFEEFKRLHNTTGSEPKAMGLGLAIVERIAKLLRHDIELRSTPDKGSCFSITVPYAAPVSATLPAYHLNARMTVDFRNITAIVIENDLQILDGMIELLQARGVRAIPTVSGEEALEALESIGKIPDIIIADYHLDSGTGLEAIRQIRDVCGYSIPAIVVTADHTSAVQNELTKYDVSLLRKPIRAAHLFEEIKVMTTQISKKNSTACI
jgi:two-component system, sensor histidine kinase